MKRFIDVSPRRRRPELLQSAKPRTDDTTTRRGIHFALVADKLRAVEVQRIFDRKGARKREL